MSFIVGKMDLVEQLLNDPKLMKHKAAVEGLEDMKLLLHYCNLFGCMDEVGSLKKIILSAFTD